MIRFLLLLLVLAVHQTAFSIVHMTRVDAKLFINQPQTSINAITVTDAVLKRKMVQFLFDNDRINHQFSKAYNVSSTFEPYYAIYEKSYRLIDLDRDSVPELIFNGFISKDDDREYLEIFRMEKEVVISVYNEVGHVLAYKLQPNTGEILLYHHEYPCCTNASHSLNRLRLVDGKMQKITRYFLGRDSGMRGKFFPDRVHFSGTYKSLAKLTELRWCPEVIEKGAWDQRSQHNLVTRYEAGSVYKILAEEKGWYFVLVHAPPKEEPNMVINPVNFREISIFGWIDTSKL